mmetsp:Transcript_4056/g.12797  ORF Transcript_4056/g.12797 Transcript_4056/m.12797 type:complete len:387 (+) Transcript_4056:141-1301(+)
MSNGLSDLELDSCLECTDKGCTFCVLELDDPFGSENSRVSGCVCETLGVGADCSTLDGIIGTDATEFRSRLDCVESSGVAVALIVGVLVLCCCVLPICSIIFCKDKLWNRPVNPPAVPGTSGFRPRQAPANQLLGGGGKAQQMIAVHTGTSQQHPQQQQYVVMQQQQQQQPRQAAHSSASAGTGFSFIAPTTAAASGAAPGAGAGARNGTSALDSLMHNSIGQRQNPIPVHPNTFAARPMAQPQVPPHSAMPFIQHPGPSALPQQHPFPGARVGMNGLAPGMPQHMPMPMMYPGAPGQPQFPMMASQGGMPRAGFQPQGAASMPHMMQMQTQTPVGSVTASTSRPRPSVKANVRSGGAPATGQAPPAAARQPDKFDFVSSAMAEMK